MNFEVAQIDEVLATTRAVRRRLDLNRPVDNQLLLDCIDLAEQAPTGGNLGSRRWMIVRDEGVKDSSASSTGAAHCRSCPPPPRGCAAAGGPTSGSCRRPCSSPST